MTSQLALLPSKQALRRMDALAIAWAITFLVLGVIAWNSLRNLAQLGVGLGDAAESLELAARAVALLGEVPVVGDSADQLSTGIEQAAASTRANAEDVRSNVPVLAAVIGLAIAVLPLPLLAGVYLPLRLARRREVQGLRRLLSGQVDPLLVEHLAHGAVSRIPYAQLWRVTDSPWQDLASGRHHRLAAAELRRLGIDPPASWIGEGAAGPGAAPATEAAASASTRDETTRSR